MEHLAVVPACAGGTLRGMVESLSATTTSGSLVVVVGGIGDTELAMLTGQRGRFGSVSVVLFDRSAWDPSAPVPTRASARGVVRADRDQPFATAWNRAMHPRARVASAVAGKRS
jgi:hypothetical protein